MKRLSFLSFLTVAAASFSVGLRGVAGAAGNVPPHRLTGMILSVSGNTIVVERHNGQTVTVDLTEAIANQRVGIIRPTLAVVLHGSYLSDGTFHCVYTSHAGPRLTDWAADQ